MFILDKKFIEKTDYSWFANKLDDNFKIELNNESMVIFGYNGIGKSTIFNCIKSANNEYIDYLDYDSRDDKIFGNTKLEISVNINQIQSNKNKINEINKIYDVSGILKKNYNITTANTCKTISKQLNEIRKNKIISINKTSDDINSFIKKHKYLIPKVLIDVWPNLKNVDNVQQEIDNSMKNQKYILLKMASKLLTGNICPVCDSTREDMKQHLEQKMQLFKDLHSELVDSLEKNNLVVSSDRIEDYLAAYRELISDENLLTDYILCNGNIDNFNQIKLDLDRKKEIEYQNNLLISQAKTIYDGVYKEREHIEKDFKRYFDVENVDFDSENYKIIISFPRSMNEYSTGEINLMSFLFNLYSFIGSDKKFLILDDPASSLDLMNYYKIAFEIVRNSRVKHMVVLTHSVDFVNIINSQHRNHFKFYYLEECNSLISIKSIKNNEANNNPNVITLSQINGKDDFVKILLEREDALDDDEDSNVSFFHYTQQEKFIDDDHDKLSNYKLADFIENFGSFSSEDFYTDSLKKIKYICALRIWVEQQIYLIISTEESKIKSFFNDENYELSKKIEFIFPKDGSNPYNLSFRREDIMSKKVMLNQGIHYHSRVMPMAYAINLSFDQLSREINEIKNFFSTK